MRKDGRTKLRWRLHLCRCSQSNRTAIVVWKSSSRTLRPLPATCFESSFSRTLLAVLSSSFPQRFLRRTLLEAVSSLAKKAILMLLVERHFLRFCRSRLKHVVCRQKHFHEITRSPLGNHFHILRPYWLYDCDLPSASRIIHWYWTTGSKMLQRLWHV